MEAKPFEVWVERYRAAWQSNDPDQIGALFSEDAKYFDKPAANPWVGRDEIVREWLQRKDEPGDTTFTWRLLAVEGGLGVVRAVTDYASSGNVYDNLWEIELDPEGRCSRFVEWFIQR